MVFLYWVSLTKLETHLPKSLSLSGSDFGSQQRNLLGIWRAEVKGNNIDVCVRKVSRLKPGCSSHARLTLWGWGSNQVCSNPSSCHSSSSITSRPQAGCCATLGEACQLLLQVRSLEMPRDIQEFQFITGGSGWFLHKSLFPHCVSTFLSQSPVQLTSARGNNVPWTV